MHNNVLNALIIIAPAAFSTDGATIIFRSRKHSKKKSGMLNFRRTEMFHTSWKGNLLKTIRNRGRYIVPEYMNGY